MGGENSQAKEAKALADTSAQQSQGQANKFGAQNSQLFSTLFGNPAAPGGAGGTGSGALSGGTLSQFMDPKSLNVTAPTGPYALQYNQAKAQGATNTDQAKQAIMRDAGNAGFGSGAPSGYTGYLKSQADLSNAGNNGQLFSQFAGNSYKDALTNFWNANNIAASQVGTSGNQQNTAQGNTNSTYTQLYGATPKATTGQLIGQGLASAAGSAATAYACVCRNVAILADADIEMPANRIAVGMTFKGQDGRFNRVLQVIRTENIPCVHIITDDGCSLFCSESHTLVLHGGGYTFAKDAEGKFVRTTKGLAIVTEVNPLGQQEVFKFLLDGSHTFRTSGIWSME